MLTMIVGLLLWSHASAAPAHGQTAPPNDDFKNRVRIQAIPFSTTQSTVGATLANNEGYWCNTTSSVWFEFTPAESIKVDLDTFGSDYDTVLVVYKGAKIVSCNNDASLGLRESFLRLDLTAGQTYQIAAGGVAGATGTPCS